MIVQEYNLFPTAITIVKEFLNTQQCIGIQDFILSHKIDTHSSHSALKGNINTTFDTETMDVFPYIEKNVSECNSIVERLSVHINTYANRTGYGYGNYRLHSWYTVQQKYSILSRHPHPGACFSGVVFINVDKDSSPLVFDTPNPYTIYENYSKLTEFVHSNYTIVPEIGDLVIFPSWLYHGSGDKFNMTDNRTIISFNVSNKF
jgi:uncharacterized protein (TIGR02466 family)